MLRNIFQYITLLLLTGIFTMPIAAQTQKHVIVSYDFSGSMKMHGLNNNDFKAWNKILENLLFDDFIEYQGRSEERFRAPELLLPIVQDEDILSLLQIGVNAVPLIERSIVSRQEFRSRLPNHIRDLRAPLTYVSGAELYFLQAALEDSSAIWINVSDEDEDVGRQSLGSGEDEARQLIDLRNDFHVVTLFSSIIGGRVKVTVRKRKSENKEWLNIETACDPVSLQEIAGKNRNERLFTLTEHCDIRLMSTNDIDPADVRNLKVEAILYDNDSNELERKVLRNSSVPFEIDRNKLQFKDKKTAKAVDENNIGTMMLKARYNVKRKLISQHTELPISIHRAFPWWILLLLLFAGLLVGGMLLYRNIIGKKEQNQFTLLCPAHKKTMTLSIKKDETVRFGKPASLANETDRVKVFEVRAPDYSLTRIDDQSFRLNRQNKDSNNVLVGKPFKVIDRNGKEIQLFIQIGSAKLPTTDKKRKTLGTTRPKKRTL